MVFELSGTDGAQVFNFEANTAITDVVSAINLVSEATGVSASQTSGVLTLQSTEYGDDAFVSVNVYSEGSSGTFEDNLSASRQEGTDISARVNGFTANGDGNTLSVNTATLDLSATITAGVDYKIDFQLQGGGALFQIGPDVVVNQQARIGIQSVNSASLQGDSGRLYSLGSGESAALATDPNTAAQIVDEVITKVSSLRGRLGAFQKTTLDTNIRSLNDTLENLTEAESAIRDADFAKESASLTSAVSTFDSWVQAMKLGATAGLSSSASKRLAGLHCWTSQQWHPNS